MPQSSIYYACGRIGVLNRTALNTSQIDRLMMSHSYEDACKTLSDMGYMVAGNTDFQQAADEHVKKACNIVRELTTMPELTDLFVLRYDIHNLKVLLKSRYLGQKPEYLSTCGTMDVEMLRHAVAEHRYSALCPILRETMESLEKALVKSFDALLIDARLDQAMYQLVDENLKKLKVPKAKEYFTAKADLQNIIILLRVRAMHKPLSFYQNLILPGGKMAIKELTAAFDDEEKLISLVRRYGVKVCEAASKAVDDARKLPFLEKATDDYLMGLFADTKYQTNSIDVLIAYLLRTQRSALNVRLILTGKLNNFGETELKERVRDMHG